MIRRAVLAGAAAALIAPREARAQTALVTIRVGALPQENSAEVFYGTDMGFFKKAGLDVQVSTFTNGAAIGAAVASAALDIGISDLASVINAHVHGLPFVYLAPGFIYSETAQSFAFIVKGDSPIRGAKDLSGKTIGTNGLNNISVIQANAYIEHGGGDWKTVKWIEIPIPAQSAAVTQGTLPVGLVNDPALTAAIIAGQRVIYMGKDGIAPTFLLNGWITTRDWALKNAATAAKFVAAIRDTAEWANRNGAAAAPILAKYTKLPQGILEKMKRGQFAQGFDAALVDPVIAAAVRYGIVDKPFKAADIFFSPR